MIWHVTAAAWPVPAAQRETGLRPPGKLEHFQHSRGVGRAPGEGGQSARQGRTSSAIACAFPAAFQMKAQLLVTGESPKACRDRDVPLQTSRQAEGQRRWGLSMILCLVREDLSSPWEAQHRLATGLAVPPRGTAPEPGSGLAWRHPLPLSGDKELKPGGPQQDLGLLGWSRLESQPGGTGHSLESLATSQHEAKDASGEPRELPVSS